jgi:carbonic anhydrase
MAHKMKTLMPVIWPLAVFLTACTSPAPTPAAAAHWSYSGEDGPSHWDKVNRDFALCAAGTRQSPVDIAEPSPQDLPDIVFKYQPSRVNILNNGHTIQVQYDPGSYIEVEGTRYDLAQFHVHAPSEHTLHGKPADAELHFVHKAESGKLAVVGVLLNTGSENAALKPVWDNLPAQSGPVQSANATINAESLLPARRTTYRYDGSLTTPPCSEGVRWLVITDPIQLSEAQLAAFTAIFKLNSRPVQPMNQRQILQDSSW